MLRASQRLREGINEVISGLKIPLFLKGWQLQLTGYFLHLKQELAVCRTRRALLELLTVDTQRRHFNQLLTLSPLYAKITLYMSLENYVVNFYDNYIRLYDEKYFSKTVGELYILFLISVPLALLLFILFNRHRHKMLVDLGDHKWLIKN